jgi:hypothetical protein
MLPVRKHHTGKCDLVLSLHGVTNDHNRVDARLAVWNDVVRLVQVSLVDILGRNEIVDFDRVGALELHGIQLFLIDLDILSFQEFVASALMILVDDPTGLFVHHLLPQPMAGLGIDLVKMGSFRLG